MERVCEHFADRWAGACEAKGAPVCVGIDPVLERLPPAPVGGGPGGRDPVGRIERWCMAVLDAVADHVPCVKAQSACFERYGAAGVGVYHKVIAAAKDRGLIAIGDAKRGDIGASSAHYAAGLLGGEGGCDALTVSGYLGADGLAPFVEAAAAGGKGLFVLVRTSNPGGDAIQGLELADGRTVAQAMADMVASLGADHLGENGQSLVGAVVAATKPDDAASLRRRMPRQIFLAPGFGAQGGGARGVQACRQAQGGGQSQGGGVIVTASRSVIYAPPARGEAWTDAVARAGAALRDEVAAMLG